MWAADTWHRSRAVPCGTTGNPNPVMKIPSLRSMSLMRIAAAVSPTMIGTIGVSPSKGFSPASFNAARKCVALSCRHRTRSGCCSMNSTEANALAATVGDDAELVSEAADLLFHLTLLLKAKGLSLSQVADELAAKHPSIHVLHRAEKNGLGRAYIAGFQWALTRDYEFIMEMDGDFSHNPDDIPKFLTAAQTADLVIGSRYCNGIRVINWPLNRLMLSMGAAKYVRIITGMPVTDPTGGFKCFRRRALKMIDLDAVRSNGYSFQIELTHKLWRVGMKIAEVPIIFTDRFQGTSKMSGAIVREALLRERYRGGQAFFVCPRIEDLEEAGAFLRENLPEAKFVVAHGQMPPSELEDKMSAFYDGKFDILLSTTIVESGLDIPSANTLIVWRADMFGLAQLYQLRGRVGRGKQRGYAYLTWPNAQRIRRIVKIRVGHLCYEQGSFLDAQSGSQN